MKIISICVASILLATTSVSAAPTPLAIAWEKFDGHSRAERVRYAKGVLNAVNSINAGLPLLKPSEAEWIAKEKAEIDKLTDVSAANDRWGKLYILSPEYRHQQFEVLLRNTKDGLECVLNSSAESKAVLQREMYCWAAVNLSLSDRNDLESTIEVLQNSGRLSLKSYEVSGKNPEPGIIAGLLGRISMKIQAEVIIPYLRGDDFKK